MPPVFSIWEKDLTYLKKVGPQRAKVLASEAGLRNYEDLLHYFPRKYVDRSQVTYVRDIEAETGYITLVGKLLSVDITQSPNGRGRVAAMFTDGTGQIELNWFQGVRWLEKYLRKGEEIAVFGKPVYYNGRYQLSHPELDYLNEESSPLHTLQIVPYYSSSEKLSRMGLDGRGFRGIMAQLMEEVQPHLRETLSPELLQRHRLMALPQALHAIHFPPDFATLEAARRRLKFDELFYFQLLLAGRRHSNRSTHAAPAFSVVGNLFNTFYHQHLPFTLTEAQKRVIREVRRDLAQPVQMNRLIQGDVGSGKTMVAFLTMLIAADNGYQSCLMAPTEILAQQHYKKLSEYAAALGKTTALLTGGQKKAERNDMLERMASGDAMITVGTHALIEDHARFQRLGLVVVDEQHKFGVLQRARLWQKASPYPHNMVMTATPIPRTLAMTLYGDVDVSVIDELPPGRVPIRTAWRGESRRLEVWGFVKSELQRGRQVYVVYPLVEESEKSDLLAAVKGQELLERYFSEYRIGLVHGRMKPEDKELEMQRFLQNKTHILVSTTVIEVGVDVPNATLMLIENAERFGLSQLHQLRGRVGRNAEQSYCILMTGDKVSNDAKARLRTMVETTDGFRIAEQDLRLRGPGDFLGTRQSGLPEFQLADITQDQEILQEAREAAFSLYAEDPQLALPQHQPLRIAFERYKSSRLRMGTVA